MEELENKPDYKWLNIDSVKYKTLLNAKYKSRKKYKEINDKVVQAFISGTIQRVDVKKGKKIKTGDDLCILEAMKMNNVIRASRDGVIKKVHIKSGDQVTKNQLLFEFV